MLSLAIRPNLAKIGSSPSSLLKLEFRFRDPAERGALGFKSVDPLGDEFCPSEPSGWVSGAVAKATGDERVSSIPCMIFQNWLNGSPGSD